MCICVCLQAHMHTYRDTWARVEVKRGQEVKSQLVAVISSFNPVSYEVKFRSISLLQASLSREPSH